MNSIQNLLIPVLLVLALIHLFFFKNKITNRILFILLFITSLVFAVFPDLSNRIAHWLGADTGADLVFYITIIIFYATFLFLFSKIKKLEAKQTEMIRKMTIENALSPTSHEKNKEN